MERKGISVEKQTDDWNSSFQSNFCPKSAHLICDINIYRGFHNIILVMSQYKQCWQDISCHRQCSCLSPKHRELRLCCQEFPSPRESALCHFTHHGQAQTCHWNKKEKERWKGREDIVHYRNGSYYFFFFFSLRKFPLALWSTDFTIIFLELSASAYSA